MSVLLLQERQRCETTIPPEHVQANPPNEGGKRFLNLTHWTVMIAVQSADKEFHQQPEHD